MLLPGAQKLILKAIFNISARFKHREASSEKTGQMLAELSCKTGEKSLSHLEQALSMEKLKGC
jgi:hypothetical protein